MSRFFDYSAPNVARIYDKHRSPVGVDVIAGLLHVHCRKLFKDIHLLDAGCGTGMYARSLLDMGVGKITLLDASREMLDVAEENLNEAIKIRKIDDVVHTILPNLPFNNDTFDSVMFNQSLHHLDNLGDGKYFPLLEQALENTRRILRQDGVLIITTILSSTIRDSVWYLQLQADMMDKISRSFMPVEDYRRLFDKHAFHCITSMNLLTDSGPIHKARWDPNSPLSEEWRQATNFFGIASDREIEEMKLNLLDKKSDGSIDNFIADHDFTKERGLVTLFACVKK